VHRGRYGSALARQEFDTDFLNPTDDINGLPIYNPFSRQ
jgi:hypothetical protein